MADQRAVVIGRSSAKAAGGGFIEKWLVLTTDQPLPFWYARWQLPPLRYVGSGRLTEAGLSLVESGLGNSLFAVITRP